MIGGVVTQRFLARTNLPKKRNEDRKWIVAPSCIDSTCRYEKRGRTQVVEYAKEIDDIFGATAAQCLGATIPSRRN
jgi:hypothetical protein